jgi:hypothetical protein
VRGWMHGVIVEELRAQGRPYHSVKGTREERLRQSVGYIKELLKGFRRG